MTKLPVAIAAACALFFGLGRASAQIADEPQTPPPQASPSVEKTAPAQILAKIHKTNEAEMKIGTLAKERAESWDVRDYADRLVKDHGAADAQLEALAAERKITVAEPVPASAKEEQDEKREQEKLKKFESLTGVEFDRAFLECMVKGHEKAIAELKQAAETVGDKEVANFVRALLPTLEKHRDDAAKLLKSVPSSGSEER